MTTLILLAALGAPPVENKCKPPVENRCAAPAVAVEVAKLSLKKPIPAPPADRFTATDGTVYERGSDGHYRAALGAPAVAPVARPFRNGDYHSGHDCPACGRQQLRISGSAGAGQHFHTCPVDGTVWKH